MKKGEIEALMGRQPEKDLRTGLNIHEWMTFAEETRAWTELTREAEETMNVTQSSPCNESRGKSLVHSMPLIL